MMRGSFGGVGFVEEGPRAAHCLQSLRVPGMEHLLSAGTFCPYLNAFVGLHLWGRLQVWRLSPLGYLESLPSFPDWVLPVSISDVLETTGQGILFNSRMAAAGNTPRMVLVMGCVQCLDLSTRTLTGFLPATFNATAVAATDDLLAVGVSQGKSWLALGFVQLYHWHDAPAGGVGWVQTHTVPLPVKHPHHVLGFAPVGGEMHVISSGMQAPSAWGFPVSSACEATAALMVNLGDSILGMPVHPLLDIVRHIDPAWVLKYHHTPDGYFIQLWHREGGEHLRVARGKESLHTIMLPRGRLLLATSATLQVVCARSCVSRWQPPCALAMLLLALRHASHRL